MDENGIQWFHAILPIVFQHIRMLADSCPPERVPDEMPAATHVA
jgi:hypothetical protein